VLEVLVFAIRQEKKRKEKACIQERKGSERE
jgi:hypothetical protein